MAHRSRPLDTPKSLALALALVAGVGCGPALPTASLPASPSTAGTAGALNPPAPALPAATLPAPAPKAPGTGSLDPAALPTKIPVPVPNPAKAQPPPKVPTDLIPWSPTLPPKPDKTIPKADPAPPAELPEVISA